jgi:hypothetical protein
MSLNEKITQELAIKLTRRNFLKALGTLVTGLGLAIIGKVEITKASQSCCNTAFGDPLIDCGDIIYPQCPCRIGGTSCPSGCTQSGNSKKCCLNGCQWSCKKCIGGCCGTGCVCAHDDMVACPGQYCGSVPRH